LEESLQVDAADGGRGGIETAPHLDLLAHLWNQMAGMLKVLGWPATSTEIRYCECRFLPSAQRQLGRPPARLRSTKEPGSISRRAPRLRMRRPRGKARWTNGLGRVAPPGLRNRWVGDDAQTTPAVESRLGAGAWRGHVVPPSQKTTYPLCHLIVDRPIRPSLTSQFEVCFPASTCPIQPVPYFFPWAVMARGSPTLRLTDRPL
jgi:hypothetical protein